LPAFQKENRQRGKKRGVREWSGGLGGWGWAGKGRERGITQPTDNATTMRAGGLLVACIAAFASAQDEEGEGRSVLLLYKKMEPMEGFAVGVPINVTLAVFNKGACCRTHNDARRRRRLPLAPKAARPAIHPPGCLRLRLLRSSSPHTRLPFFSAVLVTSSPLPSQARATPIASWSTTTTGSRTSS
jgi:hypothetical protein